MQGFQTAAKVLVSFLAVEQSGGFRMNRLQAKFYGQIGSMRPGFQFIQNGRRQAVRTGSDCQSDYTRKGTGFCKVGVQDIRCGVGVGMRLKVGNEFGFRVFGVNPGSFCFQLMRDAAGLYEIAASIVAEDAAAYPFAAVQVGAGHAGIQGSFHDLFCITLSVIEIKGIVTSSFKWAHGRVPPISKKFCSATKKTDFQVCLKIGCIKKLLRREQLSFWSVSCSETVR